ncbi:MAG TPA: glycosyltransferase [Chthonomonadales bacterium]|nr:glycosyltransferase [Chthonomonadales bacterium]
MRFAFYCRSLRHSGGRAVALGLLEQIAQHGRGHEWLALVPDDAGYRALQGSSFRASYRNVGRGALRAIALGTLGRELRAFGPDALANLGSLACRTAPCPQAVLVQNAWMVTRDPVVWRMLAWRERAYYAARAVAQRRALHRADCVLVQTPAMAIQVHRVVGIPLERIGIVPHAVNPDADAGARRDRALPIPASRHSFRALCLARYFPHKNLEVLLAASDDLVRRGRTDIGIVTTVGEDQGAGARPFVAGVARRRGAVLVNAGPVPTESVRACHDSVDAMVLPSLIESFSGAYPDAMAAGKPIITSDRDFARVVCADAALYVDPLSPRAIADALCALADDPALRCRLVDEGARRLRKLALSWRDASNALVDTLERLATRRPLPDIRRHPWFEEYAGAGGSL